LELCVGAPDRRLLIGGVFQFDQSQWQTVDEDNHIGSAVVLRLDHRELIDHEPVVRVHVDKIDQSSLVPFDRAIGARVFHIHAVAQHLVEGPVRWNQRAGCDPQDLAQRLLLSVFRDGWIESVNGLAQAPYEDHVAERLPFGLWFAGSDLRTMPDGISEFPEPR
jgi:hypothetical protein